MVGTLALQAKIIDEPIFVGLVVMTIVTILIAGPLMKYYLHKHTATEKKSSIVSIVNKPERKQAGINV